MAISESHQGRAALLPATVTSSNALSRVGNLGAARPGDFPLGSLESRAATRAMLEARGQGTNSSLIYRVPWGGRARECEVLDYQTGLEIRETFGTVLPECEIYDY
jgi:hypothetical protein